MSWHRIWQKSRRGGSRSSPATKSTPAMRLARWWNWRRRSVRRSTAPPGRRGFPFPTSHPLWAGNLPPKATEIANRLTDYDAVFGLGGKSLITVLYTEGSAVPPGCAVFQMSADVRDLGRTYPTPLSVVGDIKASLVALLPILAKASMGNTEAYAALRRRAAEDQRRRRESLAAIAASQPLDAPVTTPLVAAQQAVRAIGPNIAIVDEAIATSTHVRNFLNSPSIDSTFLRGGGLGWGCPPPSAARSASVASPLFA